MALRIRELLIVAFAVIALVATARTTQATFFNPTAMALGLPLGEISSSGSSATLAITPDNSYLVQCSAAACVGGYASCSCTYGNVAQCQQVAANTPLQVYAPGGATTMAAISASGSANCEVWPVLR